MTNAERDSLQKLQQDMLMAARKEVLYSEEVNDFIVRLEKLRELAEERENGH